MTAEKKIIALQEEILKKQNELEQIKKDRQDEIAKLISTIGLEGIDNKTLMGALLSIKNEIDESKRSNQLSTTAEGWQQAGEKFLRKSKRSKSKNNPPAPSQSKAKKSA